MRLATNLRDRRCRCLAHQVRSAGSPESGSRCQPVSSVQEAVEGLCNRWPTTGRPAHLHFSRYGILVFRCRLISPTLHFFLALSLLTVNETHGFVRMCARPEFNPLQFQTNDDRGPADSKSLF